MTAELKQAFKAPNKDQLARRHLSNIKQQGLVDGYAQAFRSTLYSCQDVSQPETRARFIEGLKPSMRLYVEEQNPSTLDAAILLAQAYDTTRYGGSNQGFREAEVDSLVNSAGEEANTTPRMAIAKATDKAMVVTTTNKAVGIKEVVEMVAEVVKTIRQRQLVSAVARQATWQTAVPTTYLQRLKKTEPFAFC